MEKLTGNIHHDINYRGVLDAWTQIFIKRLREELVKQKIVNTYSLLRSIRSQLIRSGDSIHGVIVRFHMYGRFVDMGVGRGMKAYERGGNKQNRIGAKRYGANVDYVDRRPRRWFNKRKMAEIYRLREILNRQLEHAVVQNFKTEFGDFTEYSVNL